MFKDRVLVSGFLFIQGDEPRTVQAAGILLKQGVCKLTMLGDLKKIKDLAAEFHVDLSLAKLIDPSKSENLEKYAQLLHESRKQKVQILFSFGSVDHYIKYLLHDNKME
jgi:phosphotransacetylase